MIATDELGVVKNLVQGLLKTRKVLRMYPRNNPVYAKTLKDNAERFRQFFTYRDSLSLRIGKNEIFFDSEPVYSNPDRHDNLALFFFKDGLRELNFAKDLSDEEMEGFLRVISQDYERDAIDDDVVTALWERDFQNIQYVVDDGLLSDEYYEPRRTCTEHTGDNLQQAYEDTLESGEDLQDINTLPLTEEDIRALMAELEKEGVDRSRKIFAMLFEMLRGAEEPAELKDISDFFMQCVEYSVATKSLQEAAAALTQLKKLRDAPDTDRALRTHALKIIHFSGTYKVIGPLGSMMDSEEESNPAHLMSFVQCLGPNAIDSLMKVLGEVKTIHARRSVIDALVLLGPQDMVSILKGLNDSRWYLVRNTVHILRKIGDKSVVDSLVKVFSFDDVRVRKEVIRTLGVLGGPQAMNVLRDCLRDKDRQIRQAALLSLGSGLRESSKRVLLEEVGGKEFHKLPFPEKKEYFQVLSTWKDNDVSAFFVEMLQKRAFWRRSRNNEKRACAAYALGLTGTPEALQALKKWEKSGNKVFREQVQEAIERIERD